MKPIRVVVLLAFLPMGPLRAQGPPAAAPAAPAAPPAASPASAPADLGTLLREAAEESPVLRAAAARLEGARRAPSQASSPPDPEISLGYVNDGVSRFTLGESEFASASLTWRQEVPYPGKLRRSGEAAAAAGEMAARDLDRLRLEIGAAVKSAFADLYRLDRAAALLEERREVLRTLAATARRRYEAGEGTQEGILKAQTEILRLEADLARVGQERRAADLALNAAIGRAVDRATGPVIRLPEARLPVEAGPLEPIAASSSPLIGRSEAAVRRGEAAVDRARLDRRPDFVWSAGYENRGGLDPMVMGTFGLRLPIHRGAKQEQALLQAQSELAAAREERRAEEVSVRTSVGLLVSRVERSDRLIALIGQGVIPLAQSALESARASYSVGRVGLLDVLGDLSTLFNARIEMAAQEAERLQALAALEPLLGRELIAAGPDAPGSPENEGEDHAATP